MLPCETLFAGAKRFDRDQFRRLVGDAGDPVSAPYAAAWWLYREMASWPFMTSAARDGCLAEMWPRLQVCAADWFSRRPTPATFVVAVMDARWLTWTSGRTIDLTTGEQAVPPNPCITSLALDVGALFRRRLDDTGQAAST